MKKLFAVMLAVLMIFAFAACGDDKEATGNLFGNQNGMGTETPVTDTYTEESNIAIPTTPSTTIPYTNNSSAVKDYVEANKYTILSSMEQSFATSSGMTCTSSIDVQGNGFIIKLNINELDNIDSATKAQMQSAYDSMSGTFSGMLDDMKKEIPELEYFKIQVCEVDGDLLATINAD